MKMPLDCTDQVMSFQDVLEWLYTAAWSKIYLAEKQRYSTYE